MPRHFVSSSSENSAKTCKPRQTPRTGTLSVGTASANPLSRSASIALPAALAGYAVHNLFVFDNLYSYVYFFALLALIDSQVARPIERLERAPELDAATGATFALPVAAVVALALVWSVNVSGMRASAGLIDAMTGSPAGIGANIAAFEELSAHPSFAAQEIREQLVSFAGAVTQSSQATGEQKQQAVSLAIREMQKQVAAYPLDARGHLQLSYAYRAAGDGANTLKEIQAALALSPQKESFWIEAGALAWDLNDAQAARKYFDTAYALGPQFPDLAVYAAAGAIAVGDTAAADKLLRAAFGTTVVDSDVLAFTYYRVKDWPRLIALWKQRTDKPNASVETWFSLAAAYYAAGRKAEAAATINAAVARYPDAASAGAAALKQIEGGAAGQ